jgi:Spy/CpxP family protein refolding chaperone
MEYQIVINRKPRFGEDWHVLCDVLKQWLSSANLKGDIKMKRSYIRKALIVSAILFLAGAGIVWARGGYGGMMGYGGGYGGHMMGYGNGYGGHMMGPGYGPAYGNLSPDQYSALDNAREKFYDQTQDLRDQIDAKNYAIQEELNKPNPDRAKLESLQKELSTLRSQYDKDAMNYHLAVRKILPDAAGSPAYGNGYRGSYGW